MSNGFWLDKWPSIYDEDLNILWDVVDNYPQPETDSDDPVLMESPYAPRVTASLTITTPRKNQHTIAKGRDFYVIGNINSYNYNEIPEDSILRVRVIDQNDCTVREVICCHKDDQEHMFIDNNPLLEYFVPVYPPTKLDEKPKELTKEELKAKQKEYDLQQSKLKETARISAMPDLVCSTDFPAKDADGEIDENDALKYTWNKAYYTDTFFSALIYGGEYGKGEHADELIRTTDINGNEILPLEEGEYTLSVQLERNDANKTLIGSIKHIITIGDIPNKIMAAFSYTDQAKHFIENEEKTGQIMFWDAFPSVWSTGLLFGINRHIRSMTEQVAPFAFLFNKKRAAFNDAAEYRGGKIHFYNYGIMSTSAALNIEMAEVIRQREEGKEIDVTSYFYRLGEPGYEDGEYKYYHSKAPLVKNPKKNSSSYYTAIFDNRYPCELTRWESDYWDSFVTEDGIFNPDVEHSFFFERRAKDMNNPVYSFAKKKIAILGVCPLPEQEYALEERDEFGRWDDIDRTISITYKLTRKTSDTTREIKTVEKEVGMIRRMPDARDNTKIVNKLGCFEFRHVFDLASLFDNWEDPDGFPVEIRIDSITLLRRTEEGKLRTKSIEYPFSLVTTVRYIPDYIEDQK